MMFKKSLNDLSRREREIMDVIYRKEHANASEVQNEMSNSPSYSTVRALLKILEEKGYLKHEKKGQKYIYYPSIPKNRAIKSAIENLMNTFFNNSIEKTVAALLENNKSELTESDFKRLTDLIEMARKEENNNE